MARRPKICVVDYLGRGFLAVMARPNSGEFIDEGFASIANFGIQRIVSLLNVEEAESFGLGEESEHCRRHRMKFLQFPLPEREVPPSVRDFSKFTRMLHESINDGINTVIHCRAGIGRSGMVTAGVLLHAGIGPKKALTQVSEARGTPVPETTAQRDWILDNHKKIARKGIFRWLP